MASALMDGLIAKKTVNSPSDIICSDLFEPSLENARAKGIKATKSNAEVCSTAKSAIVLAVKPNIIPMVCKDVANAYPKPDASSPLIISIAAGVNLETLQSNLPGFRVARVMPNTPCLVGEATSGFAMGDLGSNSDRAYTTVMTVLSRLEKKGFLFKEKEGRSFVYRPVNDRKTFLSERLAVIKKCMNNF